MAHVVMARSKEDRQYGMGIVQQYVLAYPHCLTVNSFISIP